MEWGRKSCKDSKVQSKESRTGKNHNSNIPEILIAKNRLNYKNIDIPADGIKWKRLSYQFLYIHPIIILLVKIINFFFNIIIINVFL